MYSLSHFVCKSWLLTFKHLSLYLNNSTQHFRLKFPTTVRQGLNSIPPGRRWQSSACGLPEGMLKPGIDWCLMAIVLTTLMEVVVSVLLGFDDNIHWGCQIVSYCYHQFLTVSYLDGQLLPLDFNHLLKFFFKCQ